MVDKAAFVLALALFDPRREFPQTIALPFHVPRLKHVRVKSSMIKLHFVGTGVIGALAVENDLRATLRNFGLAQSLGDEDREAPRDKKGNRCTSSTLGRDYASHLD